MLCTRAVNARQAADGTRSFGACLLCLQAAQTMQLYRSLYSGMAGGAAGMSAYGSMPWLQGMMGQWARAARGTVSSWIHGTMMETM